MHPHPFCFYVRSVRMEEWITTSPPNGGHRTPSIRHPHHARITPTIQLRDTRNGYGPHTPPSRTCTLDTPTQTRTETGKWHLGYAAWNMTPTERGFDSWLGYYQGEQDYYYHDITDKNGFTGFDFWKNKEVLWSANGTYGNDLYTAEAVSVIESYAG